MFSFFHSVLFFLLLDRVLVPEVAGAGDTFFATRGERLRPRLDLTGLGFDEWESQGKRKEKQK